MAVPKQLHAHIPPTALLQAQVDILKSENSPPRGWVVVPSPSDFLVYRAFTHSVSSTHNEAKGGMGISLLKTHFFVSFLFFFLQELKANKNAITMDHIEVKPRLSALRNVRAATRVVGDEQEIQQAARCRPI